MFIPSVSALDLGEGKVKLNQSDYEKYIIWIFPQNIQDIFPLMHII